MLLLQTFATIFIITLFYTPDKQLLQAAVKKLTVLKDKVMSCKTVLSSNCVVPRQRDVLLKYSREFFEINRQINEILRNENINPVFDHGEVKNLLRRMGKVMDYEYNTQIDICLSDSKCLTCLRQYFKAGWSDSCDNDVIRGLIKQI